MVDWGGEGVCCTWIESHEVFRIHLVGDGWGAAAHFKALGGQVPVGARPLACQLHAAAVILLHNLAQTKVLQWQFNPISWALVQPLILEITEALAVRVMQWHQP